MECHFKKLGKLKINKYQLRCVEDARGKYRITYKQIKELKNKIKRTQK